MAGPSLRQQLDQALGAIVGLRTEIEGLQADNEALRDRVASLQAQLDQDSTNSSKPPSADSVGPRKKRAQRRADARADKRSQGKQPAHPAPTSNVESPTT